MNSRKSQVVSLRSGIRMAAVVINQQMFCIVFVRLMHLYEISQFILKVVDNVHQCIVGVQHMSLDLKSVNPVE